MFDSEGTGYQVTCRVCLDDSEIGHEERYGPLRLITRFLTKQLEAQDATQLLLNTLLPQKCV